MAAGIVLRRPCSASKFSMAVMPCGTVLLGMTMTVLFREGQRPAAAAMMMFLLLGRTKTISAGVRSTALRMSSVEGFMVWPPSTIRVCAKIA